MEQNLCYHCFQQKPGAGVCPHCGYDPAQEAGKYPLALPCGTILCGRYILGAVLGQGGFGITYIAQDYQQALDPGGSRCRCGRDRSRRGRGRKQRRQGTASASRWSCSAEYAPHRSGNSGCKASC
ncbi:MAG: hypothetical protein IJ906_11655 [Oscillospiraceae bacterium]|nr:hypothetical protein [Oscillospiraceae bacterium]